jgi:hypothetical protein
MKPKTAINVSVRALFACGVLVAGMLALPAHAQFTYTNGDLIGTQIYDGTNVDAALNPYTIGVATDEDHIGVGAGSGVLTVQSGTLTINANDFKVSNFAGANTGALNVGSGATLNVNMIGQWAPAIGQYSSGSVTISNGATATFNMAGSNEQCFGVGNAGGGGVTATVTILGGTLNLNLVPGTALTQDKASVYVGDGGTVGLINLMSGTINNNMPLPFALGCIYNGMSNGTPTLIQNTGVSVLTISNGVFVMTNICASADPSKATFSVGNSSYVNFCTGGTGKLSLVNYSLSDYTALVSYGAIRINGQQALIGQFTYATAGNQGTLVLNPSALVAPVVTAQPWSPAVYQGHTAQLSVVVGGTPAPSYQWMRGPVGGPYVNLVNGANFSGVTNLTLTISNLSLTDPNEYVLVASNIVSTCQSTPYDLTVLAVPASSGAYSSSVMALNPVAYWPLNDTQDPYAQQPRASAPVYDAAAGMHDGLYLYNCGNAFYSDFGPQAADGYSVFSDGQGALSSVGVLNNNYAILPALNLNTNTVTITMWIKPNGNQNNATGLLFDHSGANNSGVCYNANQQLGYTWNNDSGTWSYAKGPVIPINMWSYIAVVISPTNASFYVINANGVASSIYTYPHAAAAWGGSSSPDAKFCIGNDAGASGRVFNGEIDEVAVFNYCLTPSQVISLPGVSIPATVSMQPSSVTTWAGRTAQLTATGLGTPLPTYQWQRGPVGGPYTNLVDNGTISGSTRPTLTISNVTLADSSEFNVVVSNGGSTAQSSNADLMVLVAPLSGAYSASVLALSPVAYWPLDDHATDPSTGAALAYDAAGTHDGLYLAATTNGWNGTVGPESADGYPAFNGVQGALLTTKNVNSSYVRLPALNMNATNVTITMWIYPNGVQSSSCGLLVNRNDNSGPAYSGTGQLGYNWNNLNVWKYNLGPVIPTNMWSLIGLVVTPTNASLYVINTNGVSCSICTSNHGVSVWGGTAAPDDKIRIGADSASSPGRTFNGRIDEVAIFNYALASNQVVNLTGLTFTSPVNTNAATAGFVAKVTGAAGSQSLNFSWAPDHMGWQLYSNSVGLASRSSWFPVPGSASVTNESIRIDTSKPSVFFQLRYP